MQLKICLTDDVSEYLKSEYAKFIFLKMKEDLRADIARNLLKYRVRESVILKCPFIKWKSRPETINLANYVSNCLELVKIKGEYVVRVNESQRVSFSQTKVKTLVRILEYGTLNIPPLPIVRRLFLKYSLKYKYLFVEFMKERMSL